MTNISAVRIGLVFPDLLGTYGDRGNAVILCERLRRRGLAAELVVVGPDQAVPGSLDCYVLGGGEDHTEGVASPLLRRSPLVPAWERGAAIVAVCAGFQLLGARIELGNGTQLDGVGLVDAVTRPALRRSVGDVVLDSDDETIGAVSGFENHRGTTTVARPYRPLGRIRGDGRAEGILEPRLLATYLHGPVLVRNPALADHVLSWIVGPLPPLRAEADALHEQLIERFGRRSRVRRVWRRAIARDS